MQWTDLLPELLRKMVVVPMEALSFLKHVHLLFAQWSDLWESFSDARLYGIGNESFLHLLNVHYWHKSERISFKKNHQILLQALGSCHVKMKWMQQKAIFSKFIWSTFFQTPSRCIMMNTTCQTKQKHIHVGQLLLHPIVLQGYKQPERALIQQNKQWSVQKSLPRPSLVFCIVRRKASSILGNPTSIVSLQS